MAIIHGQIESLKQIRAKLDSKGITRFNSISEINSFSRNFKSIKTEIVDESKQAIENEILAFERDLIKLQEVYEYRKLGEGYKLKEEIIRIANKHKKIKSRIKNPVEKAFQHLRLKILKSKEIWLNENFEEVVFKRTFNTHQSISRNSLRLEDLVINKSKIAEERSVEKILEIEYQREAIEELNTLIAGAVGENLVVNELAKLSNESIVFNDFSIRFDQPIFHKKNDLIFSIQIDHLVLTRAGIFILETKNWSKKSIANLDLRSPVDQIRRTSYAINKMVNDEKFSLKSHHWGKRKIPVKNLIVMINNKPEEQFQYVAIKTLNELNNYISYFEPVMDQSELRNLERYLMSMIDD